LIGSVKVGDQLHESGIEIYLINFSIFRKENSILEWNHENLQSGNKTWKYKSQTIGFYLVPSNSYKPFPSIKFICLKI